MTCPICEKDTHAGYRPFCSKRCADVDLAKWLGGGYSIASSDPDDEEALIDALEKAADQETDGADNAPNLPRPS